VGEHDPRAPFDFSEDGCEARVVECQALHVFVNLDAGAAVFEQGREVVEIAGIVEVHGAERDARAAQFACGAPQPSVQFGRHTRLVRVTKEDEALDPGRT
jgi:hypothetical protein